MRKIKGERNERIKEAKEDRVGYGREEGKEKIKEKEKNETKLRKREG